MNWFDILIILIILFSGVLGFKRGVFKELISFLGIIIVFILAYKLKNYIGDFLILNFPFVNFSNGITALNIVFYQSIAFVIVAIVLYIIYEFILAITGVFEKILRFTIILGIPSKFLGFFIGLIKGVVIAYILVFFVNQPALNLTVAQDSKYSDIILTKTPVLTQITSDTVEIIDEITNLKDLSNANDINLRIVDLVLEKEVTSVNVIEELVERGKLNIKNIDNILSKYKESKND